MRLESRRSSRKRLFVSALLLLSVAISVEQDNVSAVDAATIVSVTTTKPNGTYKVGDQMWINLNFSEPVTLGGAVSILLETGLSDRNAYCDGPPRTLQVVPCTYTVQVGDRSNDLDVQSKWAIIPGSSVTANGVEVSVTANGVDANLLLPVPGEAGSLSASSAMADSTKESIWNPLRAHCRGLSREYVVSEVPSTFWQLLRILFIRRKLCE